ncbi:ubiquitin C-terminal hydrolase CreB, variant [Neurospora crassa OR74A]|nr:ubiquitin C-terminal hydrolase CreB, variant [Neurospora crassa OR74A]ESA44138.1 ubiquitin C-terminal hydrolase CreB, variant [Neurospora crassa OR74A]|eukprot:XP_011393198.1 ubiquitin C-terminal hydrolase CreB, variant [Neurospora crassa OR74A]
MPITQPIRPEDRPDAPEYKKKQAMIKGPVLELTQENPDAYGMEECTFTGLKDIFTALIQSNSRTGVISPQRFLDIFKRDNEMFRNSMHQDAHEFYGLVLNDVISNVEAYARRMQESRKEIGTTSSPLNQQSSSPSLTRSLMASNLRTPETSWVHDIFEGVLVSETRCLTCETVSQRDETFLDLSIDLEEHSSVTSCLRKFSAEEMLCERNKFHCDRCGGLQEAEKRMKIKKLPKVLALHLKRFKYTEDYSRLQKLFHRVVYPYYLRMFNTTDDAEDPDRIYELYAVIVHIGGNAYHGHYVSIIKTKDRGWVLFDDEMVEPVDKNFVANFFGDKPGMACAYVLFYQEVTFEKMREELDAEGLEEMRLATQAADLAAGAEQTNGTGNDSLTKVNSQPTVPVEDLDPSTPGPEPFSHPLVAAPPPAPAVITKADEAATVPPKSKDELTKEKKEQKAQEKAQEKARKAAEKEAARLAEKERLEKVAKKRGVQQKEQEQLAKVMRESKQLAAEEEKRRKKEAAAAETGTKSGPSSPRLFNRAGLGGKSLSRKSFAFLGKTGGGGGSGGGGGGSDKSEKSSDKDKSDRAESSSTEQRSNDSMTSNGVAESNASSRATTGDGHGGNRFGGFSPSSPSSPLSPTSRGPNGIYSHNHHLPSSPMRSMTTPDGIKRDVRASRSASTSSILGPPPTAPERFEKPPLRDRFSFSMGRKKSSRFLS